MTRYARDPRWLRTRYPGTCAQCNTTIPTGTPAFYYPVGKKLLCAECGKPASAEFEAAAFDEEVARRALAEPRALYDATPARFRSAPVARPQCVDCKGPLADERGNPLPYWDRQYPRCTRCHNRQVRGEFVRRIPVFIADIVREDAPPSEPGTFPIKWDLRPTVPPTAEQFHDDWEELQRRLGLVLRAFYYDPANYLAAVNRAVNALAKLRYATAAEHRVPPDAEVRP
jgi:hypothetical protein